MRVGMIAVVYISKYLIEWPEVDLKTPRRGVLQVQLPRVDEAAASLRARRSARDTRGASLPALDLLGVPPVPEHCTESTEPRPGTGVRVLRCCAPNPSGGQRQWQWWQEGQVKPE